MRQDRLDLMNCYSAAKKAIEVLYTWKQQCDLNEHFAVQLPKWAIELLIKDLEYRMKDVEYASNTIVRPELYKTRVLRPNKDKVTGD